MATMTVTSHTLHRSSATRPARPAPGSRSTGGLTGGVTRPVARPAAAPVRLTRRGRVVLTLLLLGIVMAFSVFVAAGSAATARPGEAEPVRTVVVEEGDTLWGIAAEVAGDDDLRETVFEIQRLNGLSGPQLTEGQALAVPVG